MPKYTQYNPDTGQIIAVVNCSERDVGLYQPCISGEYSGDNYTVQDGVAIPKQDSEIESMLISRAWQNLRVLRSGYLKESDWTQVPDAPVDQAAWATYRQQLRDLPNNTEDPANPAWPTKPE